MNLYSQPKLRTVILFCRQHEEARKVELIINAECSSLDFGIPRFAFRKTLVKDQDVGICRNALGEFVKVT